MHRWSQWVLTVVTMIVFTLGFVHCGGEDGNPFYALSSPSAVNGMSTDGAMTDDVPGDGDVSQDEAVLADASFVDQLDSLDALDGSVSDVDDGAIPDGDASDVSDAEDGAIDIVFVFPDLTLPDVVTPSPDVVPPMEDVVDASAAMDVVMKSDVVSAPDIVMPPDIVLATDVVDASVPIDRPDVPPAVDAIMMPDVVMVDAPDVIAMSDRPDVVSLPDVVDVPPVVDVVDVVVPPPDVPVIPDFVVEYLSVSGGVIIPSGGSVDSISVAFNEGGSWRWRSYTATRLSREGSSFWFRVIMPQLTPQQRTSPGVLLSIGGGCGLNTGSDCPSSWWTQWRVEWMGTSYVGSSWFGLQNRITCRDVGGFEQGCVRFSPP